MATEAFEPIVLRRHIRPRVVVAVGALVLLVVAAAAGWSTADGPMPLQYACTMAAVAACAALVLTAGRRCLHEVRVDAGTITFVHADRTDLSVPIAEVGAIGHCGWVCFGHLIDGPATGWGDWNARLTVRDRQGRALFDRRAAWLSIQELEDLCARVGIGFAGRDVPELPVMATAPPPIAVPAPGTPATEDPATAARLARSTRQRRLQLGGYVAMFVVGWLLAWVSGGLAHDSPQSYASGWTGGILLVSSILLLLLAPANENRPRRLRRALRGTSWELVEVVVLGGLGQDASKRTVGVCLPGSAYPGTPESWWSVRAGGRRGWLQGSARRWCWLARSTKGSGAILATLDHSHLARLDAGRDDRGVRRQAASAYEASQLDLAVAMAPPPPMSAWPPPAWPGPSWPAPTGAPIVVPPPGWVPPPPVPTWDPTAPSR